MAYCAPRGIPHWHFLGGPAGVWTQHDRDAALAWTLRERRRCPRCGTHPDDFDPALGGRPDAYKAHIERCLGCAETAKGQKVMERDEKNGDLLSGSHLVLKARPSTQEAPDGDDGRAHR